MGNLVQSLSRAVIKLLEAFFYRWGKLVATYPLVAIAGCLLVTGLCCIGYKDFR